MAAHRPVSIEVDVHGNTPARSLRDPLMHCSSIDCFRDMVSARADQFGTIILAVSNAGFARHWHNFRCSMERLDVARHAIVVGTDIEACDAARSTSVPCVVGDGGLFWGNASIERLSSRSTRHGTAEYARLMHVKAKPCLTALTLGYDVLFSDTDMMWLRNPLKLLRRARQRMSADGRDLPDVMIQSDYDETNEARCSSHEHCPRSSWCDQPNGRCEAEACGGFYWLRAQGGRSVAFLQAMFERMAWQRAHIDERLGEQPALNFVLHRTAGLTYQILDRKLYPNGNTFFARGLLPGRETRGPVIVHNNWLAGDEPKVQRWKEHGMWLLAETPTHAAATDCMHTALRMPMAPRASE